MEDALCDPDPQLRLIETLRWDGQALRDLPLHMQRMQVSARRLGWACDIERVEHTLRQATPVQPARMRVTLDRHGDIQVTSAALPLTPPVWRIALSPHRLRSDDPWLGIKSTRRALYDAERANLPDGVDEVIFANERDEICEGTITNLFFDRGKGMHTPPLSCGLLAGVLRANLLASGKCKEGILRIEDLSRCQLWVGNSLRGIIAAALQ